MREIEQEVYAQPETVQQKDSKQTAAVDLSKRLKDFRSANDAASLKGALFFFAVESPCLSTFQLSIRMIVEFPVFFKWKFVWCYGFHIMLVTSILIV